MIQRLLLACTLFIALFMTSCSFKETITVNEDGSGKMEVEMDGSQLMGIAGSKMRKEEGKKRIDSTLSFKELFSKHKDSIATLPEEKQKLIEELKGWDMHLVMDAETEEMIIGLQTDFENISSLSDMMRTFSDLKKLDDKPDTPTPKLGLYSDNLNTSYTYDAKTFTKKVEQKKAEVDDDDTDPDTEKMVDFYRKMFEESTYTVHYIFPNKIKSVSNKNAVISKNRKEVTIKYQFIEYMDDPERLSLTVKFEK